MPADSDASASQFTHFESTESELPIEFYFALGRALYRWSQLEASVSAIAVSTMGVPWLEATARLRGKTGFKVKNNFQKLRSEIAKLFHDPEVAKALDSAEMLYEKRKILFHSVWGFVTGQNKRSVGIQEWSNTDYSNFRPITVEEIVKFSDECLAANQTILQRLIPHIHGKDSLVVNDEDGNLV